MFSLIYTSNIEADVRQLSDEGWSIIMVVVDITFEVFEERKSDPLRDDSLAELEVFLQESLLEVARTDFEELLMGMFGRVLDAESLECPLAWISPIVVVR